MIPDEIPRRYYGIEDAAKMLGVSQQRIRTIEGKLRLLYKRKSRWIRMFTESDINELRVILAYLQYFSYPGLRRLRKERQDWATVLSIKPRRDEDALKIITPPS